MAAVSQVNLVIQKGTHFDEIFTVIGDDGLGENLSGKVATAKLKKHPTSGIAFTFSTTITVGDSTVKISMPSSVTSLLPSGRCVYDVVLTSSGGIISKVLEGTVIVNESVSV